MRLRRASMILTFALIAVAGMTAVSCGADGRKRRLVEAFYDATDAKRFDEALSRVSPEVVFDSWAQAINGNHLGTKRIVGREGLRPWLGGRGLCRNFYGPDGPFYRLGDVTVSGPTVSFELHPDRKAPDGRPYNIYRGEFTVREGKISAITMVEVIGWL